MSQVFEGSYIAELQDLKEEIERLQIRLSEQSSALLQAREEQREVLSLVKAVIDKQTLAHQAPATVYSKKQYKSWPHAKTCFLRRCMTHR